MSKSSKTEVKAEAKTVTTKPEPKPETAKPQTKTESKPTLKAEDSKTKPMTEPKPTPKNQSAKTAPKTTPSGASAQDNSPNIQDSFPQNEQMKTLPEVLTSVSSNLKASSVKATPAVQRESQAKTQEPGIPNPTENGVADSTTPRPKIVRFCKPNYAKYEKCKKVLVDLLRTGSHTSSVVGLAANVASTSTLFKYQSLASNETGLLLMTSEEKEYMMNNSPPDKMAKIETRLREQNKGLKLRYADSEALSNSLTEPLTVQP